MFIITQWCCALPCCLMTISFCRKQLGLPDSAAIKLGLKASANKACWFIVKKDDNRGPVSQGHILLVLTDLIFVYSSFTNNRGTYQSPTDSKERAVAISVHASVTGDPAFFWKPLLEHAPPSQHWALWGCSHCWRTCLWIRKLERMPETLEQCPVSSITSEWVVVTLHFHKDTKRICLV